MIHQNTPNPGREREPMGPRGVDRVEPAPPAGQAVQEEHEHEAGRTAGRAGEKPTRDLSDRAREAKDAARHTISDAAHSAKEAAAHARHAAGEKAAEATRMLREKGQSLIEGQKGRAAGTIGDIGHALSDAGDRLERENDPTLARYVHSAAESVRSFADELEHKPVGALLHDLREVARRRPEWFVGGMFVAGLALARFAKSASEPDPRSHGHAEGHGRGASHEPRQAMPTGAPHGTTTGQPRDITAGVETKPASFNVPNTPAATCPPNTPAVGGATTASRASAGANTATGVTGSGSKPRDATPSSEPNAGTNAPGNESGRSAGVVPSDPAFRDRRTP